MCDSHLIVLIAEQGHSACDEVIPGRTDSSRCPVTGSAVELHPESTKYKLRLPCDGMESDVLLKTVEELIAVETSEIVYTLARPKIIKHRMFLNGQLSAEQSCWISRPNFRSPGHEIFRMDGSGSLHPCPHPCPNSCPHSYHHVISRPHLCPLMLPPGMTNSLVLEGWAA